MKKRNHLMMKNLVQIISCLLLLSWSLTSVAQHTLQFPSEYKGGKKKISSQDELDFYILPYKSDQLDLVPLKNEIPELDVPDVISIQAPYLGNFEEVVVVYGLIKSGKIDENSLIIILAADYQKDIATFFIDENQDRNFNNDVAPLAIQGGGSVKVTLKPYKQNVEQSFMLSMPGQEEEKAASEKIKKPKAKIKNQLTLGGHVSFSTGSLKYEYDNTEIGFPTTYQVNMSEKNIGVGITYSFPNWQVGVEATYQNLFYGTSYLVMQLGPPIFEVKPLGDTVYVDHALSERNKDLHTDHRFQSAFLLGGRIHFSETVELQPALKGGLIAYMGGKNINKSTYDSNRYQEGFDFELPASPFAEIDLRLEVTIGEYRAFFTALTVNKTWWQPEGMFEALPQENLNINYLTYRLSLGYRVALFK